GVHITESLGILMFTALGFVLFLRALDPENTISIDTDWFYRRAARYFTWLAEKPLARYEKAVSDISETAVLPFLHGTA
ncbi:MAG: Na+/H+ antiporter subunit D, partial [Mesorhizobium sp.]